MSDIIHEYPYILSSQLIIPYSNIYYMNPEANINIENFNNYWDDLNKIKDNKVENTDNKFYLVNKFNYNLKYKSLFKEIYYERLKENKNWWVSQKLRKPIQDNLNQLNHYFCSNGLENIEVPKIANTIRFLTFNVHSFSSICKNLYYSNENKFPEYKPLSKSSYTTNNIIDLVKNLDIDFLMLQEFSATNLKEHEIKLNNGDNDNVSLYDLDYFRSQINDFKIENTLYSILEGNGIDNTFIEETKLDAYFSRPETMLFNSSFSKMNILEKKVFKFPSNRLFNSIKVEYKTDTKDISIIIFNIHPNPDSWYNNANNRNETKDNTKNIKDIRALANFLRKSEFKDENILIFGDFNCYHLDSYYIGQMISSQKNPHKYLEDIGFFNTYDLSGSFNSYDFTGHGLTVIDYCYINKNFLNHFSIEKNQILNVNFSDHLPLLVDFKERNYTEIDLSINYSICQNRNNLNYNKLLINNNSLNKLQLPKDIIQNLKSTWKFKNVYEFMKKFYNNLLEEYIKYISEEKYISSIEVIRNFNKQEYVENLLKYIIDRSAKETLKKEELINASTYLTLFITEWKNDKLEIYNIMKNSFFDIKKMIDCLNLNIITIPKGTIFLHKTSIPVRFELQNTGNFIYSELSTVPLIHINESGTTVYGKKMPTLHTRTLWFKLEKDIQMINITGFTAKKRVENRLKFYKDAISYIFRVNNIKKVNPKESNNPWNIQLPLQGFFTFSILKSLQNKNINFPVGIIISDIIMTNQNNSFNDTSRYVRNFSFWNNGKGNTVEGLEYQLYAYQKYTKLTHIEHDNILYDMSKSSDKNDLDIIFENKTILLNEKKEELLQRNPPEAITDYHYKKYHLELPINNHYHICQSIINQLHYLNFVIKNKTEQSFNWFFNTFHNNDVKQNLFLSDKKLSIININIEFLLTSLHDANNYYLQLKIIHPELFNTTINTDFDITSLDNVIENITEKLTLFQSDYIYNTTSDKQFNSIINVFISNFNNIKEKILIFITNIGENINHNLYFLIILYFFNSMYRLVMPINLRLTTLFKYIFSKDSDDLDIILVNYIKQCVGVNFYNKIKNDNKFQLVKFNLDTNLYDHTDTDLIYNIDLERDILANNINSFEQLNSNIDKLTTIYNKYNPSYEPSPTLPILILRIIIKIVNPYIDETFKNNYTHINKIFNKFSCIKNESDLNLKTYDIEVLDDKDNNSYKGWYLLIQTYYLLKKEYSNKSYFFNINMDEKIFSTIQQNIIKIYDDLKNNKSNNFLWLFKKHNSMLKKNIKYYSNTNDSNFKSKNKINDFIDVIENIKKYINMINGYEQNIVELNKKIDIIMKALFVINQDFDHEFNDLAYYKIELKEWYSTNFKEYIPEIITNLHNNDTTLFVNKIRTLPRVDIIYYETLYNEILDKIDKIIMRNLRGGNLKKEIILNIKY